MPFFSEETLQAVRSIPLYEIVRPQVELSRSGRNWRGLSPFSQEKTPSFYVLTEGNFYKCHSTGMAGDGIRFVQETEKLTFPEAVEALSERFGIPVSYADGRGPDPEERSLRQALLDIHEYACDYYHRALMADHKLSEKVRRYWVEERGFSLDLAREFRIGFSPPESPRLLELLEGKGFSREALTRSGLFHTGREGSSTGNWFYVFRGRLMIPICDLQGQVVAFTARQLEETPRDHASWKAKYINSPETPLFKKSQLLFNLDRARETVREAGRLVLVEGQLDALRSWSCGLREAVAPQGTSVTEEQVKRIKRYTDCLEVLLDSDDAGKRAALRLLPMAFAKRLEVRVMELPEEADPDDFLREKGLEGFEGLERISGITFAGKFLMARATPGPEGRAQVLEELFGMIASCPSAIVREGYFEEAAAVVGVPQHVAFADYERAAAAKDVRESRSARPESRNNGTISSETLTNLERDLLWAVLQNVAWIDPLAQVVDHQWIKTHLLEGKILSLLLAQATVDRIEGPDDIYFLLDSDEERDCFHRLQADARPQLDMELFVNQTIASLVRRFCREEIKSLEKEISLCYEQSAEATDIRELSTRKNELIRHLSDGIFPEVSLST